MPDDVAPRPLFSLEVERQGDGIALVRCHGSLEANTTEALSNGVRPLFAEYRSVILDLSDIWHINSEGLGAVIYLLEDAKAAGCRFALARLSRHVRHVLTITHLLSAFTVIEEESVPPPQ
jgi:anti-anti-sigma factor